MHRKRGRMRRTRKKKVLIDIESSGIRTILLISDFTGGWVRRLRIEFMDISFIEKVI